MLKTIYILSLGQLFKIALELKQYLWQNLKLKKTKNLSKTTMKKQVDPSMPKVWTAGRVIDNHMVVIRIQIGKNTIEDMF
jgi:hypothetical protein